MNWSDPKVKSDKFSLLLYEETLRKALLLDYQFVLIKDAVDAVPQQSILLRHDIEYSVECAYEMAQVEQRLGVKSSYFVLVHSVFYNPFSPNNTRMLLEMVEMGHEIGLHYETYYFEDRGLNVVEGIRSDANYLGQVLGVDIKSVSQHRPARSSVVEGIGMHYVDAYRHDLIYELFYISDSGVKWRNINLMECLGKHKRIHALLHPDYWNFSERDDLPSMYRKITKRNCKILEEECDLLIRQNYDYLLRREQMDFERQQKYALKK
jgi:hypothetical protein